MADRPDTIAGVLLAGGHSRRMGRDKAWLPHPETGEPMLLRQLALLDACTHPAPMVSARIGQSLPPLPSGTVRVEDDGKSGPLGGLIKALSCTTCEHLIVIAVDLPNLDVTEIKHLSEQITSHDHGVYAHPPRGPQPLVSILPRSCLPALQCAFDKGQLSLRRIIADQLASRMTPVDFTEDGPFRNWNQPGSTEG